MTITLETRLQIEIKAYKEYATSEVRESIWTVDGRNIPLHGLSVTHIRMFISEISSSEVLDAQDAVLLKALNAELHFRKFPYWKKVYKLRNLGD